MSEAKRTVPYGWRLTAAAFVLGGLHIAFEKALEHSKEHGHEFLARLITMQRTLVTAVNTLQPGTYIETYNEQFTVLWDRALTGTPADLMFVPFHSLGYTLRALMERIDPSLSWLVVAVSIAIFLTLVSLTASPGRFSKDSYLFSVLFTGPFIAVFGSSIVFFVIQSFMLVGLWAFGGVLLLAQFYIVVYLGVIFFAGLTAIAVHAVGRRILGPLSPDEHEGKE